MRKTHTEQREQLLARKMKADAAEIAAAREAKQAAQAAAVTQPPAVHQPLAKAAGSDSAVEAARDELEEEAPKELSLLPGDGVAIAAMLSSVQQSRLEQERGVDSSQASSAERAVSSNPFARQVQAGRASAPSNPFARKRPAPAMEAGGPSAEKCGCGHLLEKDSQFCRKCGARRSEAFASAAGLELERIAKRPRCLGSRMDGRTLAHQESTLRSVVRPVATPSQQPESRRLAATVLGPRGGKAASDAVAVVLAQRGMPELEAVEPSKDRGKLTGFFRQHQRVAEVEAAPKASALASWRARPWEKDVPEEESSTKLSSNPLSHRQDASRRFSRAW
jgi:hypothetical protein